MATSKLRHLTESGVSRPTQVIIVTGVNYSWDRLAVAPATSLWWRTPSNTDIGRCDSWSLLCLRKPTDPTALAVVFQNFESVLKDQQAPVTNQKEEVKDETFVWFKAGFLSPDEIRKPVIQMCYVSPITELKGVYPATLSSTENYRSISTNP